MDFEQIDISRIDRTTIDIWMELCNTRFLEICQPHYVLPITHDLFTYENGIIIMDEFGKANLPLIVSDEVLVNMILGCPDSIYLKNSKITSICSYIRTYEILISDIINQDAEYFLRLCKLLTKTRHVSEIVAPFNYKPLLYIEHGIDLIADEIIIDIANKIVAETEYDFSQVYMNVHVAKGLVSNLYRHGYFGVSEPAPEITKFISPWYHPNAVTVDEVFDLIHKNLKKYDGL